MSKIGLLIFLIVSSINLYSQNLVPNYSFEEYSTCPDGSSQITKSLGWYNPTMGTSDYFHSCSTYPQAGTPNNFWGHQIPLHGSAYAGFFVVVEFEGDTTYTEREYVQIELTDSLIAGTVYFVSFSVSIGDSSNYATDDIGLYFSNDSVINYSSVLNLNVTPQVENTSGQILDLTSWQNISGQYIALGGEKFITIGNFKDQANTTNELVYSGGFALPGNYLGYYYLDEVCISSNEQECISSVGMHNKQLIEEKKIAKIIDSIGREIEYKPNTILIYLYDDGSSEKVFVLE